MDTQINLTELDPRSGISLYVQVARSILTYIRSCGLKEDEAIATPREIGALLGVNELTVRRGVKLLIDHQLLYSVKGKGSFVTGAARRKTALFVLGLRDLQLSLNDYFQVLFREVNRLLEENGYAVEALSCTLEDTQKLKKYCSEISSLCYEGYICSACNPVNPFLKYIKSNSLKHVWITDAPGSYCGVFSDMAGGRKLGLDYLFARGKRELTVFSCTNNKNTHDLALAGLQKELPQGCELKFYGVKERHGIANSLERGGYELMSGLLNKENCPQALFITDNLVARGASRALLERGHKMSQDNCVVMTTSEQALPLGFPVMYSCRSIAYEARLVVDSFLSQVELGLMPESRKLEYFLSPSEEVELG